MRLTILVPMRRHGGYTTVPSTSNARSYKNYRITANRSWSREVALPRLCRSTHNGWVHGYEVVAIFGGSDFVSCSSRVPLILGVIDVPCVLLEGISWERVAWEIRVAE